MSILASSGRFILVFALCAHAVLMITDPSFPLKFQTNLQDVTKVLPQIKCLNEHADHLRYGIAGLYFSSVFCLITTCSCVQWINILGIVLFGFVTQNPITNTGLDAQIGLLKNISIIGALFFLMGSFDCIKNKEVEQINQSKEKKVEVSPNQKSNQGSQQSKKKESSSQKQKND